MNIVVLAYTKTMEYYSTIKNDFNSLFLQRLQYFQVEIQRELLGDE